MDPTVFTPSPLDQPMAHRVPAVDLPPSARVICSPYDPDARFFRIKRQNRNGAGNAVHLSENL